MVVLVTIASVVVCGWIEVWLLSDVGAAWLGAVAGLPVPMLPASTGTVILRRHRGGQPQATAPRTSSRFSALGRQGRNVRSCATSLPSDDRDVADLLVRAAAGQDVQALSCTLDGDDAGNRMFCPALGSNPGRTRPSTPNRQGSVAIALQRDPSARDPRSARAGVEGVGEAVVPARSGPFGRARGAALGRILGVVMCRPEVLLPTGSDASTPPIGIK